MKTKGLTLIELLVVIMIIGFMAAVALPAFTSQLETSRASEALQKLGNLKASVTNCLTLSQGNIDSCFLEEDLEVQLPSQGAGSDFTYGIRATASEIILSASRDIGSGPNAIEIIITPKANGMISSSLSAQPKNSTYTQLVKRINNTSNMSGTAVGGIHLTGGPPRF